MNELRIYENPEFGKVRTMEINGEPYFVGKDVADILEYSNPRKAIIDNVDDEDKGVTKCDTLGGTQELTVINESGLYMELNSRGAKLSTIQQLYQYTNGYNVTYKSQVILAASLKIISEWEEKQR